MKLKSIRVRNFRSIMDETLHCDNLTALVGPNGSGKSSFLHSLELFYSRNPKVDAEDFYNRDTEKEISITVTFTGLSKEAKKKFSSYIQNEELTVERVFKWEDGKIRYAYHGSILQNPDFTSIYNSKAGPAKEEYNKLKERKEYQNLPTWSSHSKIKEALKEWEKKNHQKCSYSRDDGQFFGFSEVASGYLGKFIQFLYIPAVRDAGEDAEEGRGSVLTQLMDIMIRSKLLEREEIKQFQKETSEKYSKIMSPSNLTEIYDLGKEMTATLQNFVPDAEINLSWDTLKEFELRPPDAIARLVEDGYQSTVNRTGHGLQRAFIMTLLQHLSLIQNKKSENGKQSEAPVLVLVIEEPELYQHPNRQRHLAEIFRSLSEGETDGVVKTMQIIYSTHSPHFVGIDRIDQIRLLRKISDKNDNPKITKIFSTDLNKIADKLGKVHGSNSFTSESLRPRLYAIMTPWMNEGFFSDKVVLVEGEGDRAAILGVAESMDYNLESMGISVIPCFGKSSIDRPAIIFREIGIPIFIVWDSDKGKTGSVASENHRLLVLMNQKKEDWPNKIEKEFACFEKNLESVLKTEIGEDQFEKCLKECESELDMSRKHARKNPVVISKIIEKAKTESKPSTTLEKIVTNILALEP